MEDGFSFLTQQVRAVRLDLLNFHTLTNTRFGKVEGRLDRVEAEVRQLREELPTVVGDVMREVLHEQEG